MSSQYQSTTRATHANHSSTLQVLMTPGADLGRVCDIVRYTYVVRNMKQAGAVCAEFHKSKKLKVVEVVDSFAASNASTDGFWLVRNPNLPARASSCHLLPTRATSCHLLPPPAACQSSTFLSLSLFLQEIVPTLFPYQGARQSHLFGGDRPREVGRYPVGTKAGYRIDNTASAAAHAPP